MSKRRAIVGLGNPGPQYQLTRHNLGYLVVQEWAERHALTFKREERQTARVATGTVEGVSVHLVLPTSYMNESGRPVRRYMNFFRLPVNDLIVVVDDVALPFGTMRLRTGGTAGGHNGLKSIEEHMSTQQYIRLRLGVGAPRPGQELAHYVLERFSTAEIEQLPLFLAQGAAALSCLLVHSVDVAMNLINSKDWQWRQSSHEQRTN